MAETLDHTPPSVEKHLPPRADPSPGPVQSTQDAPLSNEFGIACSPDLLAKQPCSIHQIRVWAATSSKASLLLCHKCRNARSKTRPPARNDRGFLIAPKRSR